MKTPSFFYDNFYDKPNKVMTFYVRLCILMKTVFMGTPEFAAESLKALYESEHSVELVITQPDRAKNRGKKVQFTPVKEVAIEQNTEVMQPEKIRGNEEIMDALNKINPDIIIVAAYGQILPEEILNLPKYGCINVHGSLLPKYRGAAPMQRAIMSGDKAAFLTANGQPVIKSLYFRAADNNDKEAIINLFSMEIQEEPGFEEEVEEFLLEYPGAL